MTLRELADYINKNVKDPNTAKAVFVDGLLHEKVVVTVNRGSGQDRIDITRTILSLWGWHLILWFGEEDYADLHVVKSKNVDYDIRLIMGFINNAIETRAEELIVPPTPAPVPEPMPAPVPEPIQAPAAPTEPTPVNP